MKRDDSNDPRPWPIRIDKFNHQEFIQPILTKEGLTVKVPDLVEPLYAETIRNCYMAETEGQSLLAMIMSADLVEHCLK